MFIIGEKGKRHLKRELKQRGNGHMKLVNRTKKIWKTKRA